MPALIIRVTAVQCYSPEQYAALGQSCHVLFHEQHAQFHIINSPDLTTGRPLTEDHIFKYGTRLPEYEVSSDAFILLEPGQQVVWVYAETAVICRLNHDDKWLRIRKYQSSRPYGPWYYLGSDELEALDPYEDREIRMSSIRHIPALVPG